MMILPGRTAFPFPPLARDQRHISISLYHPALQALKPPGFHKVRRHDLGPIRSEIPERFDLPRRTVRQADTKTGAALRALSVAACAVIDSQPRSGDVIFPSRFGGTPIVGYRKTWLRITKLGDLPADITPHVLRHSFASLAADLGYNEPTIATLLGHKTHSITSRYVHSADAVLLAAADVVANATMKLMCKKEPDLAADQAQPQLRDQRQDRSVVWDEFTSLYVFSSHGDCSADLVLAIGHVAGDDQSCGTESSPL
jgi:hypothetical protein